MMTGTSKDVGDHAGIGLASNALSIAYGSNHASLRSSYGSNSTVSNSTSLPLNNGTSSTTGLHTSSSTTTVSCPSITRKPHTGSFIHFQSIDHLFRTRPLSEIRATLREAQKNLFTKKKDLRELVGNHYQQVIESSDIIEEMNTCAKTFAEAMNELEKLQHTPITSNLINKRKLASLISGEDLFALDKKFGRNTNNAMVGSTTSGGFDRSNNPMILPGESTTHKKENIKKDIESLKEYWGGNSENENFVFAKKVKQILEIPEMIRYKLLTQDFFHASEGVLVTLPKLYRQVQENSDMWGLQSYQNLLLNGGSKDGSLSGNIVSLSLLSSSEEGIKGTMNEELINSIVSGCMQSLSRNSLTPIAFMESLVCLMYFGKKNLSVFLDVFIKKRLYTRKAAIRNQKSEENTSEDKNTGKNPTISRTTIEDVEDDRNDDDIAKSLLARNLRDELIAYESTFLCFSTATSSKCENIRNQVKRFTKMIGGNSTNGNLIHENDLEELLMKRVDETSEEKMKSLIEKIQKEFILYYKFPKCKTLKQIYDVCTATSNGVWEYRNITNVTNAITTNVDTLQILKDRAADEMSKLVEKSVNAIQNPLCLESLEPQLRTIAEDIQSLPMAYSQNEKLLESYSNAFYYIFEKLLLMVDNSNGTSNLNDNPSSTSSTNNPTSSSRNENKISNKISNCEIGLELFEILEWLKNRKYIEEKYSLRNSSKILNLFTKNACSILENWLNLNIDWNHFFIKSSSSDHFIKSSDLCQMWWAKLLSHDTYYIPISASSHLMDFLFNKCVKSIIRLFLSNNNNNPISSNTISSNPISSNTISNKKTKGIKHTKFVTIPEEACKTILEFLKRNFLKQYIESGILKAKEGTDHEILKPTILHVNNDGILKAKEGGTTDHDAVGTIIDNTSLKQSVVRDCLSTIPVEKPFGHLLQFLFDCKYLALLCGEDQEVESMLMKCEEVVFADPVDRVLYAEPLNYAVREYLDSTAGLLNSVFPHIQESHNIQDTSNGLTSNSLQSNSLMSSNNSHTHYIRPDFDPPLCSHAMRFPLLPIGNVTGNVIGNTIGMSGGGINMRAGGISNNMQGTNMQNSTGNNPTKLLTGLFKM